MRKTEAPFSSFVCLQAVMWISHFGWEKRNMTFFLTLLTLPVARPAAQKYCPHLENHHLLHRGHPHLHPHFPSGKWEKVHWKSGQSRSGATKPSSTGQGSQWERPGILSEFPDVTGKSDFIPEESPLGYYQQMQRSVSSYEQKHFSASFSSYWLFSGHMLSYCAHQAASQFFYFSSSHNSALNVNDKEKWSSSLCQCTSNHKRFY